MEPILKVRHLRKYFPVRQGLLLREVASVKAVDDICFDLYPGETLGLVGESGCGKSTLGRSLIRLYEPTAGSVEFMGEDFLSLRGSALRARRRDIQMIFQDPFASLDPRMTINQILMEPFRVHHLFDKQTRQKKIEEMMDIVGLTKNILDRYPHEFSGGQRQRLSIARSLLLQPKLVIADEPVSALDVSIQAQILNLLKDLQKEFKLTYLFISHDLSVVEHLCDRIAVMYLGKVVELASRDELFRNPRHPYTQALFQAIPKVGHGQRRDKRSLQGEVPSPMKPPQGCHFNPRCPQRFAGCDQEYPALTQVQKDHWVACALKESHA
jgi:oligopeptide transport system ATP-binding protein